MAIRLRVEIGKPCRAGRVFRDLRREFVLFLVPRVGAQIEVRPARDALQFLETEGGIPVHQVVGLLGVVGEIFPRHVKDPDVVPADADVFPPGEAVFQPTILPFVLGTGMDEELDLQHVEFADAEQEVAGIDLVAESLAHLGDAEGQLARRGGQYVVEINEDALGRFGTQEGISPFFRYRPHLGLEHQVEGPRLGQVRGSAGGTHTLYLVGAPPALALAAVHQGVDEGLLMARVLPGQRIHQDGAVEPLHVIPFIDVAPPPGVHDVVLQLDAHRAVIVQALQAAVDFRARVDDSAALAEGDELFQRDSGHRGPFRFVQWGDGWQRGASGTPRTTGSP